MRMPSMIESWRSCRFIEVSASSQRNPDSDGSKERTVEPLVLSRGLPVKGSGSRFEGLFLLPQGSPCPRFIFRVGYSALTVGGDHEAPLCYAPAAVLHGIFCLFWRREFRRIGCHRIWKS